MPYITSIGIANPVHRFEQSRIADFMVRAMQLDYVNTRKLYAIFKSSGINHRHSVLDDYGKVKDFSFYPNNENFEPFPSTEKRIQAFRAHALPLSLQAVQNAVSKLPGFDFSKITHLITVCCTGMYAPGLDIDLVKALNLPFNTNRVCINFMGCYAAINALKTAHAFCESDPKSKVLIVCTELCSLHFQKTATEDNLLANALFGDGAAAVIMEATHPDSPALKSLFFHNNLLPEGEHDMTWTIGNFGFDMKLSAYIPDLIKKGIKPLAESMFKAIGENMNDIKFIAIHPGGKKILTVLEQTLDISENKNEPARSILRNYGNMSSPTILFILNDIMNRVNQDDNGEHILSFAFGPGLTLESALFEIVI